MRVLGFLLVIVAVMLLAEAANTAASPHPPAHILGSFLPGATAFLIGLLLLRSRKRTPLPPVEAAPVPEACGVQLTTQRYLAPEAPPILTTRITRNAPPVVRQPGTMRGVWNIGLGFVFVAGGLSGRLVLRGTHSGGALAIFGVMLIVLGLFRLGRR